MINKQLFLSALLLLLSSLSLYSVELSELEIPNQPSLANDAATDAEWGWPEKFKMEYKFYTPLEGFSKFHIIGKVLSYNDSELIHMVSLSDVNTKKHFKKIIQTSNKRLKKEEGLAIFQAFVDSFNAFLTSGTPDSMKLKEYLKNMYFRSKARKNDRHNRIEHFIGIRTVFGFDAGIGLRFGLFFPGYKNFKIGFLADFIYRRSLLGVNVDSAIDMPKYIGGSLLFAVKIKGFYLAGGGFLHFRVSDEIIKNYSSSSRIRARDYGLSGSMGYISTSHFKWFAGILCRYSPSLSEDKYYESLGYHTMRQFSFGFEAGIGF